MWMFLTDKTPSGQDAVWTTPDGGIHEFFQFNDRGRGPKTYSSYRLDGHGIVISEETHGNDYMKNTVNEIFTLKDGVATWKNQAEDGHESDVAGRLQRLKPEVPSACGTSRGRALTRTNTSGESSLFAINPGHSVRTAAGGDLASLAESFQVEDGDFSLAGQSDVGTGTVGHD